MPVNPPPRKLDFLAALLSYLIPGLGQVVQGRVAKGVLYFVCLNSLFFYGLSLGQWKNVWIPDCSLLPDLRLPVLNWKLPSVAKDISYRKEFAGQFWIGIAAWPAILQYHSYSEEENPELRVGLPPGPKPHSVLGRYMQAPTETQINALQRNADKRWDLGWVYTVIAGVLNILAIYDAFAGPVVRDEDHPEPDSNKPTTGGGK